ncbi:MAG: tetratricopeptide repeat protein, partial [Pirellulales bacterium]
FCLCLALLSHAATAADKQPATPTLSAARHLLLTGKYEEASDAYLAMRESEPVAAAIGLARCQASRGERVDADATLLSAAEHSGAAELHAERAALAFDRGDYDAARKYVERALTTDRESLAARWWQAELFRTAGELERAEAGYKWFVDYYNDHDEFSADELRWVGLAAAQFARWRRLSGQFSFFVNELYPDDLKLDADFWPAHYESGLLFLEKYNDPQALRELKAALAINSNAAEVHAALAALALHDYRLDEARRELDLAIEINPKLLAAHQLLTDLHLTNLEARDAIRVLEAAREVNAVDEETLGRLAAAYAVVDGISPDKKLSSRVATIIEEVDRRNPHAGTFYYALGAALDLARRFPAAAHYYREAVARM